MLTAITRVVDFCTRYPLWIIVLGLGLATGSSFYAARHFAIKTNVYDLLSPDLPWNQDRSHFLRDFPQRENWSWSMRQRQNWWLKRAPNSPELSASIPTGFLR
jgi:predicted RND superfamily exporter protein